MITAILLAAGLSSRMGRAKLALDLGGRTVFERSLSALLDSPADRILVVQPAAGVPGVPATDRVQVVTNPHAEEGMASSIRAGMAALPEGTRAVLIALADKPLLKAETVTLLINRFHRGDEPIVYPTFQGSQGHPVLLESELFAELEQLEGDSGAKSLLRKFVDRAVEVETDDAGILLDIDTPEDYAKCLKELDE